MGGVCVSASDPPRSAFSGLLHLGCFAGQIPWPHPATASAEEAPGRHRGDGEGEPALYTVRPCRDLAVTPWGVQDKELPLAALRPAAVSPISSLGLPRQAGGQRCVCVRYPVARADGA